MQNTHQWIDPILKELFGPDHRRLTAWIDRLCEKNSEIVGKNVHGFIYAGRFFHPSNMTGKITQHQVLHSSLEPDMQDFLLSEKRVNIEKIKLKQVLFMLLEPCNNQLDIRDALPECVVDCIPDLKRSFPNRTRDLAFTITHNPRAMRLFNKLLPKMEEYSVARMIF